MIATLSDVSHRYRSTIALDRISVALPARTTIGLIGPDGVGKSTLLSLIAGARRLQAGRIEVLGGDIADPRHRAAICPRIAYMPQGLGRNLYADLTVSENIAFFGRLFDQTASERRHRASRLLAATGLAPFADRAAGNLSGGMRQKLGLCCALVHDPDLLILDEPTTGVDPLSRRQFWELIGRFRARRPTMSVLVATAYMEEAERFDWLIAMDGGRALATGAPSALLRQTGTATLEAAFVALLPQRRRTAALAAAAAPPERRPVEPVIVAHELSRRFGAFTAVDRASFSIGRGEIFGFVGSNGCGKTTTMKMLAGLLPPSTGSAVLFGRPVTAGDMAARRRVGYMSQGFSLYTELSVRQNLALHARLFHLPEAHARSRIAALVTQFGLEAHLDHNTGELPLGLRQRLSLAVAVVHEPDVLILDEPTSGVDPLARDEFWALLLDLSRRQGVTIFVSTHFMNEAARCDRLALMHAGRVLAVGTPAALVDAGAAATLEEAFIVHLRREGSVATEPSAAETAPETVAQPSSTRLRTRFSGRRLTAFAIREGLEAVRDPIRLGFALLGAVFLMVLFGAGISTDVDHLSFAVLDYDQSPESRAYLAELRGSRYFVEQPPAHDPRELTARLGRGSLQLAVEVPPNFGRDLRRGAQPEIGAWIDGAMPFRAETIRGYLVGVHERYLAGLARSAGAVDAAAPATVAVRFRYNPSFESVYAMVPSTMGLLLVLIPGILMALAIVREKELGSITNLYVTPATRFEFLVGKQLPYIGLAMATFVAMLLVARFGFQVPLKGSLTTLLIGTLLYVATSTGYGMLISAFTRTQIAALFGTAILTSVPATQFSGMLTPVSALTGAPWALAHAFPMTYYLPVIVGTFTKGLGPAELAGQLIALAGFVPILLILSLTLLRTQER